MSELIKEENISSLIYTIRGVQVIMDRDLARLYHVETKVFNQTIKRNKKRFPNTFMFQLSKEEFLNWRSQFVTSKNDLIGLRRPPYAFTEYGIAMLSGLLKSDLAIKLNIQIIDAFVKMRHFYIRNRDVYHSLDLINNKLDEHDEKINKLFNLFDKPEILHLKGEEYDAYSDFVTITKKANNELIIIDAYADNIILDIVRKLSCNIILITKDSNRLSDNEIAKYNNEYHNLSVIRDNTFHDRYLILDRKDIYHSGASINNAGDKVFSIHKINDELATKNLLDYVNNIIK